MGITTAEEPVLVPLSMGRHELRLSQGRFQEVVRTLEVAWGEVQSDIGEAIVQAPDFEIWTFTAVPAGAHVKITDARSGELIAQLETPEVVELPRGTYRVRYESDGYVPLEVAEPIEVTGAPEPGTLDRDAREGCGDDLILRRARGDLRGGLSGTGHGSP